MFFEKDIKSNSHWIAQKILSKQVKQELQRKSRGTRVAMELTKENKVSTSSAQLAATAGFDSVCTGQWSLLDTQHYWCTVYECVWTLQFWKMAGLYILKPSQTACYSIWARAVFLKTYLVTFAQLFYDEIKCRTKCHYKRGPTSSLATYSAAFFFEWTSWGGGFMYGKVAL